LKSCFEGCSLQEITAKQIEDYKASRLRARYVTGRKKRPVKKATINRELSALKMLIKKAIEWGHIEDDPAQKVRIFKETPKETRLLESDDIASLIATAPVRIKALIACAVYVGLRRSELFCLSPLIETPIFQTGSLSASGCLIFWV
jgi:site-specific recombinase XerD